VERGPPNESEREREGGREREREINCGLDGSVKHLIRGNGGNRGLNWHNGVSQPVPPLLPVQWVSRVKVKVGSKGFQNI